MKEQIREQILYKRAKQDPTVKKPKDEQIISFIESLPEFEKAENILIYISIHGEVDLEEMFNKHKEDKRFIVPRISRSDNSLDLYKITSMEDLVKGTFDVPEPKEDLEQINPEDIDIVIVPGVAFAKNGHRVGYGGGFYDRLLKKTTCPKIGVAYEFQIVENIDGEDHDEMVDYLITEKEITHITTP